MISSHTVFLHKTWERFVFVVDTRFESKKGVSATIDDVSAAVSVADESSVVERFATAKRSAVLSLLMRKRSSSAAVVAQLATNYPRTTDQTAPPTHRLATPLQLPENSDEQYPNGT